MRLLKRNSIEAMQKCVLDLTMRRNPHQYVAHLFHNLVWCSLYLWRAPSGNQPTSLMTYLLAPVLPLSTGNFVVSLQNTWAPNLKMSKTHFSGGLKCMPSTPAYHEWHITICLFLVRQFLIHVYCQSQRCSVFLPATSMDVEHVFSKGHLVLSHIHNCLTVASTHALMCLSAWSKLNLVRNADIKAVAVLPDIIGDEDDLEFGWDYMSYD